MASWKDGNRRVEDVSRLTRRGFLSTSVGGLGGAYFVGLAPIDARADDAPPQSLVVAWAAGPNGCDRDFNVSPGSFIIYRGCSAFALRFSAAAVGKNFEDNFKDLTLADASEVKVSDDSSKVTITLKHGVISPTGNELTADDAVYRYQRNWALRGEEWGFVKDAMLLTENSVVKESRYVYTINMTGPNYLAKVIQAHMNSAIQDSTEYKKHATSGDPWSTKWAGSHYAGFGPWQLTDYVAGQSWTLERNPNYYDKGQFTGNVTKVVNRVIPSSENRVALLEAGSIDIALNLQASELARLKTSPGIRVDSFAGNYLQWLGFSFDTEAGKPLRDVNVRQAIGLALPFDELLERPYMGFATQMKTTVAPIYPGFDRVSKIWNGHHDLAAAKELMAKSAYPNGFSTTLHYDSGYPGQEETAIIIKAALAELKIDVQIVKLQTADFFNLAFTKGKGFPGMFIYRDMAGTPDVNFGTHLYLKSGHCCAPGGYSNTEIDSLYKKAQGSPGEPDQRVALQSQIEDIALNKDPMGVPLQQLGFYVAQRENVGGLWWHSLNEVTFEKAWKKS